MNNQANPKAELKEIFLAACQLSDVDQRAAYLAQECGEDTDLRQRIVKMLAVEESQKPSAMERMRAILNVETENLGGLNDTEPLDIEIYPQMGPYKLLEKIGEGGMGVVYAAIQEKPIRRTVALKIIKPGMDSRQVIARFEAERQALALMNHPHIAKVLDAGTAESGSPYFVMELVRGIPITDYCDRHKLDLRQRLDLFVNVCHAVQHAHQKGVIHRDLKPSNILVELDDVRAVPKVIDFGVAKATQQQLTEHSLHTGLSQIIGTPLYMSPEQAQMNSLDVDTRSDVYSLGVLLYELLTGCTPFDTETLKQAGFDEMRRIIREVEPPNPSTRVSTLNAESLSTIAGQRQSEPRKLSQQFRGELDWIVMKAIEKDRNRRYDSASAIARDLERYLADEPIEARPASAGYRLKKFLSRNKGPAIAASLLVLGLVITSILSLLLVARGREMALRRNVVQEGISAALAKVVHLRNQASTQPQESQALLSQAREQMQRAVALSEAGQSTPETSTQVRRLLEELEQEHQDKEFARILDEAWIAQANTDPQQQRWAPEQCIPILSKALETRGVRVGQSPPEQVAVVIQKMTDRIRVGMLVSLEEWAVARKISQGTIIRLVDAENADDSTKVQASYKLLSGLDRIVGFQDGRDGPMEEKPPGASLWSMGRYLSPMPDSIVRLRVIRRGQKIATYEVVPDPVQAWLQMVVIAADADPWRNRMRLALYLSDNAERQKTLTELANDSDFARQPLRVQTRLANAISSEKKSIDQGIELLRQIQQRFPADLLANINLASSLEKAEPARLEESAWYYTAAVALCPTSACTLVNLGFVLNKLGKPDEAVRHYREALRVQPDFYVPSINIGELLEEQGRHDEAIAEWKRFVALNPGHARARYNLGTKLMNDGKLEEAVVELVEAARLDPDQTPFRVNLGTTYKRLGRFDEAIQQYREVARILPQELDPHLWIAHGLHEQGKVEEALSALRELLISFPDNPAVHNGLAWALVSWDNPKANQLDEALTHARRSVELMPEAANLDTLGVVYYRQGAWREAITALKKSAELQSKANLYPSVPLFLAMAHWQLGEHEQARTWHEKAVESMKGKPIDHEVKRFRAEVDELLGIVNQAEVAKEDLHSPPANIDVK